MYDVRLIIVFNLFSAMPSLCHWVGQSDPYIDTGLREAGRKWVSSVLLCNISKMQSTGADSAL